MPGRRRAVVVECNIAAVNGDALIKTVNQKRMMAVSNLNANQAPARLGVYFESVAPSAAPNQLNIRPMNEKDLADNRLPAVSNFYVQPLPSNQINLYENRRSQRNERFARQQVANQQPRADNFAQQNAFNFRGAEATAPSSGGGEVAKYGQMGATLNQERVARKSSASQMSAPRRGSGVMGGAQVAQQAPAPVQETRLYFVLEPDQLPMQVVPPAAASRVQPAAK
jgi:hypothetical protein